MLALAQEVVFLQPLKRAALTYNCRTATSGEDLHSTVLHTSVSGLETDSNLQVQPQSWADSRLLSSVDKTELCSVVEWERKEVRAGSEENSDLK